MESSKAFERLFSSGKVCGDSGKGTSLWRSGKTWLHMVYMLRIVVAVAAKDDAGGRIITES